MPNFAIFSDAQNRATFFDPANSLWMPNTRRVVLPYDSAIKSLLVNGVSLGFWINFPATVASHNMFGQYASTTKYWEIYLRPNGSTGRGWHITLRDDSRGIATTTKLIGAMTERCLMSEFIGISLKVSTAEYHGYAGRRDMYDIGMGTLPTEFTPAFLDGFDNVDYHMGRSIVAGPMYRDVTFISNAILTKAQWNRAYNSSQGITPSAVTGVVSAWTFDNAPNTAYLGSASNKIIEDKVGARGAYPTGYTISDVNEFVPFRSITW